MKIMCPQKLQIWSSGLLKEMMKGSELLDKSFIFFDIVGIIFING